MSKISATERSAQIYYYQKKLDANSDNIKRHEEDPFIKGWRKKKGEYILERAEIYEKLHDLGDYDRPLDTICAAVTDDLILFGLDADTEGRHVRRVLPAKYKNKNFNRGTASSGHLSASKQVIINQYKELLNHVSKDEFLDEFLREIAKQNPEEFKFVFESSDRLKEHAGKIGYQEGIALVDHTPREKKISTPKPKPGESNMHYAGVELYDSLSKFTKNWYDLVEKINQYPPTDRRFDGKIAVLLHQFKKRLDEIDSYILSLSDERRAFSILEWTPMAVNKERYSKHAAASRSGVTSKNISKNEEKTDREIEELLNSVEGMEHLLGRIIYELAEWRDVKSELRGAIRSRRDNLHDKLSDKA